MADPSVVACPKDVWTKVATGVTAGVIHILKTDTEYSQTYRATTNPAPTDLADAVPLNTPFQISAAAAIDVYIQPKGIDGSVRVDL